MARETIKGVEIAYELIGEAGAPGVALTPGGRFSKDMGGVRELAEALAAGGRQVLIWDRPNCGESDLCFEGESESIMHAETLLALARALGLKRLALAGGSAGSRVSLIAAARGGDIVSHLAIWWISGGPIGLMQLATYYCGDSATLASMDGMEAVAASPGWAEQMKRNPRNRELMLAQNPKAFIEIMQRWALAYAPSSVSPVPGMGPEDFKRLKMPVRIFRNGESDLSHTRKTSDWVHELIPHSELIPPPWPDAEWNSCMKAQAQGRSLFANWPSLAPQILEFLGPSA